MPFYESVFIARQDLTGAQAEALADNFSKIIEDNGGKVAKRENWGVRSLAYRIKKNRKGHYLLFNMDAPSAAISEMERQMRIHEDILRYLTIRLDELDENPSIMMQRGAVREERPRRSDAPPAERKPAAAATGESKPAESKPAAAATGESKPAESKPAAVATGESKPAESKPAAEAAGESKPAESSEAPKGDDQ